MEFDDNKKPHYLRQSPFRFVKPYQHLFQTHAKQRWFGKALLPLLVQQFKAYDQQYFREAINNGNIKINNKNTKHQYIVKNGDLLTHSTLRSEPPILDLPITIMHEDEDFLVVMKPPSMIVHTGGGYHYNTLLAILHYEMNRKNLYILHRLDRLTTGIIILAKSKQKSLKFHEESNNETMKKMYYARVKGDFPFQEKLLTAPIICLSHKDGVFSVFDPQNMKQLVNKQNQPKQSTTKFKKVWYDEKTDSSLLECYPITGRTHQIRVHLKFLGHSILNDVVYGGKFVGNHIIQTVKHNEEDELQDKLQKKVKQSKEEKWEEEEERKKFQQQYEKWDTKEKPWEICLCSHRYTFEGKEYEGERPYWVEKEGDVGEALKKINS